MKIINYAHRGASEYAPENMLSAFYFGCQLGADGIETDVRRTRDGVLVLFHDKTLARICGIDKTIRDMSYKELLELDFGSHKGGEFCGERIPTLETFLIHFGAKDLEFAIEIKEVGIEKETVELIRRYGNPKRTVITSNQWGTMENVRAFAPDLRTGYLCSELSEELICRAQELGLWQICPKASVLTPKWNIRLREAGFSVRAWGIDSEETMQRMIQMGVDGMTVNDPAALKRALSKLE